MRGQLFPVNNGTAYKAFKKYGFQKGSCFLGQLHADGDIRNKVERENIILTPVNIGSITMLTGVNFWREKRYEY